MTTTLEKYWIYISAVFIIATIIFLCFLPVFTQLLVWILIIVGTGIAIAFAVRRRIQAYRQKRIDCPTLLRSISLDIAGILITIVAAVLIAGKAGTYLGQAVGRTVESALPGLGSVAGILAGLLTGAFVGLGVAILVQRIFDFLARPSPEKSAHSTASANERRLDDALVENRYQRMKRGLIRWLDSIIYEQEE